MAKKTTRKLALRTETLRQLNNAELVAVRGGLGITTYTCYGDVNTRQTGSTDPKPVYDAYGNQISWG
jgi:hypothetical protein